jgi:DNA-binding NarL/FixJ family response regulator
MAGAIAELLDSSRLLFDLQQANEIAQDFSGYLEPQKIAHITTDGLVERFNSAFARIWLVEPDGASLRLVASSGLYIRTNGSFARVPMGAYKVGKIAYNRVAFLSNNLPEETWVKDREWAIANQIRGFAGFPLMVGDRVIGVLATFSHTALAPEFLEVLQVLCTTISITLETALKYQQDKPDQTTALSSATWGNLPLSDQLAGILKPVRLTLIGTEQTLALSHTYIFLQVCELLSRIECRQCRLTYGDTTVILEATAVVPNLSLPKQDDWLRSQFGTVSFIVSCLGGQLQSQIGMNQKVLQVLISLPYPRVTLGTRLHIKCRFSVLQLAFTHLAYEAGLQVDQHRQENAIILTDNIQQIQAQIQAGRRVVWVKQSNVSVPKGVSACVDLSVSPAQFRDIIEALERGEIQTEQEKWDEPLLSEREQEILGLLAQGLRDRDVAHRLIISESTVKFHMNNVLIKFKSRTRYEALYQAIVKGWLPTRKPPSEIDSSKI